VLHQQFWKCSYKFFTERRNSPRKSNLIVLTQHIVFLWVSFLVTHVGDCRPIHTWIPHSYTCACTAHTHLYSIQTKCCNNNNNIHILSNNKKHILLIGSCTPKQIGVHKIIAISASTFRVLLLWFILSPPSPTTTRSTFRADNDYGFRLLLLTR